MENVDSNIMKTEITHWMDQAADSAKYIKKENHDPYRKYYVYALCEKRDDKLVPFYIGKGSDDRMWDHEEGKEKEVERLKQEYSGDELKIRLTDLSKKYKKIEELGSKKIEKLFIKVGLTEYESFMCESALINIFRRPGITFEGSDILTNIDNGHLSVVEKQEEITTEARTVDEFYNLCKDPIIVNKMTEDQIRDFKGKKILLQNINQLYGECLNLPPKDRNNAIRNAGRAFWTLDKTLRDESGKNYNFDYVFVMFDSRIVGVYKLRDVYATKNGKKEFYSVLDLWQKDHPSCDKYTSPTRAKDLEISKKLYEECIEKGFTNPKYPDRISDKDKHNLYSKLSDVTQKKYRDYADTEKFHNKALQKWIEEANISLESPDSIDTSLFSVPEFETLKNIATEYNALVKEPELDKLYSKLSPKTREAYRELIKDTPEAVKHYKRKMNDFIKRQYFVLDDINESDSSNFTNYIGCRIIKNENDKDVKIFRSKKYLRGYQSPIRILLDGSLNY